MAGPGEGRVRPQCLSICGQIQWFALAEYVQRPETFSTRLESCRTPEGRSLLGASLVCCRSRYCTRAAFSSSLRLTRCSKAYRRAQLPPHGLPPGFLSDYAT